MIEEKGYLVIKNITSLENEIYGPNDNSSYGLFGFNGLKLFSDIDYAKNVANELESKACLHELNISIAENEKDLEQIISPFVLLVKSENSFYLVGPYVEGSIRTFDSCSYLTENGLACFDDIKSALYSCSEAARQSQCEVSIASFDLKKI